MLYKLDSEKRKEIKEIQFEDYNLSIFILLLPNVFSLTTNS